MTKTKKRWLLAGACVGILAAFAAGGWYICYTLTAHPAVRALPSSASDLHEFYRDSGFPHYDYTYEMKARMPAEEFPAYAARLGLRPLGNLQAHWGWWPGELAWWDPAPSMEGTYIEQDDDSGTMAKWENGWVYVVAWST